MKKFIATATVALAVSTVITPHAGAATPLPSIPAVTGSSPQILTDFLDKEQVKWSTVAYVLRTKGGSILTSPELLELIATPADQFPEAAYKYIRPQDAPAPQPVPAAKPAPQPAAAEKPAPAVEAKPAEKPAPAPQAAPVQQEKPAPAPQPAPPAEAKPAEKPAPAPQATPAKKATPAPAPQPSVKVVPAPTQEAAKEKTEAPKPTPAAQQAPAPATPTAEPSVVTTPRQIVDDPEYIKRYAIDKYKLPSDNDRVYLTPEQIKELEATPADQFPEAADKAARKNMTPQEREQLKWDSINGYNSNPHSHGFTPEQMKELEATPADQFPEAADKAALKSRSLWNNKKTNRTYSSEELAVGTDSTEYSTVTRDNVVSPYGKTVRCYGQKGNVGECYQQNPKTGRWILLTDTEDGKKVYIEPKEG